MRLRAMAKINLGLDVTKKREDGYHEVRMVMQTIRMYDQLDIEVTAESGIRMQTNLPYLPVNENNLVIKAAKLLMDEFDIKEGLDIDLKKVIPVAAGMAGGSTDAAAMLVGVNRLFRIGLSTEDLMQRAVVLGADVPYCILRGTALAEGIGEELTPLPNAPECYVLIGKPGISVSTKFVYGNLKVDEIKNHPNIDELVAAIRQNDFGEMINNMGNVLEEVTIPAHPIIADIKQEMIDAGAVTALMSGSGPTVFGLFDDKVKAEAARDHLRKNRQARQVFLTTFFNN